jgi:hypothetical protein
MEDWKTSEDKEEFKQIVWWVTMISCGFQVCTRLPETLLDLKAELNLQREHGTYSQPDTNKEMMSSPIIQVNSHTLCLTCTENQNSTFHLHEYNSARDHPLTMLYK